MSSQYFVNRMDRTTLSRIKLSMLDPKMSYGISNAFPLPVCYSGADVTLKLRSCGVL